MALNTIESQVPNHDRELNSTQRAQWLRAAVLGASDGLVSTTSLMMGVGAVNDDARAMLISGLAGLVAGACSMAIGEFVSVYSQLDIERSQIKRDKEMISDDDNQETKDDDQLTSPVQAAAASALAFSLGAAVPLLAAGFIRRSDVRMGVAGAAASAALVVFGAVGAALGRSPVVRSGVRVLVGGWLAMVVTFGVVKLFGCSGL